MRVDRCVDVGRGAEVDTCGRYAGVGKSGDSVTNASTSVKMTATLVSVVETNVWVRDKRHTDEPRLDVVETAFNLCEGLRQLFSELDDSERVSRVGVGATKELLTPVPAPPWR